MEILKEHHYKDIILIPQKCVVPNRSEENCNTKVKLGNFEFISPVFPSNMKSVVNQETCEYLSEKNFFYIMHRFGLTNEEYFSFITKMKEKNLPSSISVGVNDKDFYLVEYLKNNNLQPDYITIDIAHGWAPKMQDIIKFIKSIFPDTFLIAGNVCTSDAVEELENWGADATKIGLSQGNCCITKDKTGFGRPMVETIEDCSSIAKKSLIADGGIEKHGDIARAIALGADLVMAGRLFCGYDQSAGEIIEIEGKMYKEYYGSASDKNKGIYKHVEGRKTLVEYKGNMDKLLKEVLQDLRSSISYSGGTSLSSLRNVKIVKIT